MDNLAVCTAWVDAIKLTDIQLVSINIQSYQKKKKKLKVLTAQMPANCKSYLAMNSFVR